MLALEKLHIKPLGAESLGTRSFCLYVQTPDLSILVDPGVALAPRRDGFPPHLKEIAAAKMTRDLISEVSTNCTVLTISHYHFDHYTTSLDLIYQWTNEKVAKKLYKEKIVLAKDRSSKINYSQKKRSYHLYKRKDCEIRAADGQSFQFNETTIRFSESVWHGSEGTKLGWVIMTTVEYDNEKILHASDIQGPMSADTLSLIEEERPNILLIGGPPTYLKSVPQEDLEHGIINLKKLASLIDVIVVDHHLLRDGKWKERLKDVYAAAKKNGNQIYCTAEFMEVQPLLFEVQRKELYKKEPLEKKFHDRLFSRDSEILEMIESEKNALKEKLTP
jgi:predicted metallo-beta-lactamase superfamily hydrolase